MIEKQNSEKTVFVDSKVFSDKLAVTVNQLKLVAITFGVFNIKAFWQLFTVMFFNMLRYSITPKSTVTSDLTVSNIL